MSENVTEIIKDLIKSYEKCNTLLNNIEEISDKLLPNRISSFSPWIKSEPIPEHRQLNEIIAKVDNIHKNYIKDVNNSLEKISQMNFKMRFNNPNQRSSLAYYVTFNSTKNESKLIELLISLDQHNSELRELIKEIESKNSYLNEKEIIPARYIKKTRTLFVNNKPITFRKSAKYPPAICELLLNHPNKKNWTLNDLLKFWDEVAYYGGLLDKKDWHKVYETIKRLNDRIKKESGVENFFILSTSTVGLNPNYIKLSEK